MNIRVVGDRNQALLEQLLEVWEASVRATHLFLSGTESGALRNTFPKRLPPSPISSSPKETAPLWLLWGLKGQRLKCSLLLPANRAGVWAGN